MGSKKNTGDYDVNTWTAADAARDQKSIKDQVQPQVAPVIWPSWMRR